MQMIEPRSNPGIGPRDLVRGAVELASPPETYARVTALLDKPSSTAADLAQVLDKDPGITARLLRIVNSPFYGFAAKVSTVSRAITLLGNIELRDLVLATSVLEMFNGLPNDLVSMRSFWVESLGCGVLARSLSTCGEDPAEIESIFVAGLLHEVGHLVIYRKLPELAREAILRHKYSGLALHVAEQEVLGFDYAAVGAELMRAWNLPPVLEETVEFHLMPERAGRFSRETAVVHLSSRIARAGGFDLPRVLAAVPTDDPAWKRAGLRPDTIEDRLQAAEQQFAAALMLLH